MMLPTNQMGKYIIGIGLVLVVVGILLLLAERLPFIKNLGKLPGDIRYQSKDGKFVFFAPIVSSILISLILTLILNIILRIFRK
jgi:hypothetical protein